MDYYRARAEANRMIDTWLKEGKSIAVIEYKIATRYGFTEKFVAKRIEQLRKIKNDK